MLKVLGYLIGTCVKLQTFSRMPNAPHHRATYGSGALSARQVSGLKPEYGGTAMACLRDQNYLMGPALTSDAT